jgi:hypothetical protein
MNERLFEEMTSGRRRAARQGANCRGLASGIDPLLAVIKGSSRAWMLSRRLCQRVVIQTDDDWQR